MADEKKEETPKAGPTGADYAQVLENDLEMYRNTMGNLTLEVGQLQAQLKSKTDAQQQMLGMISQSEAVIKLLKGETPMPNLGAGGGQEDGPEDPPVDLPGPEKRLRNPSPRRRRCSKRSPGLSPE